MKKILPFIILGLMLCSCDMAQERTESVSTDYSEEGIADIPSVTEAPAEDGNEAHTVKSYRSQDLFGRRAVPETYLTGKKYWQGKEDIRDTGIPYSEEVMDYDAIRFVDFSNAVATEEYISFENEGFTFTDFLNTTILGRVKDVRLSGTRESADISTENPGLYYVEVLTDDKTFTVVYIGFDDCLYIKGIYNETDKYLIELISSDEIPSIKTEEVLVDTDGEPMRVPCVCGCGDFEDECTDNEPCRQPDYILSR